MTLENKTEDERTFWRDLLTTHLADAKRTMQEGVTEEDEKFMKLLNKVASEGYIELSLMYGDLYNRQRRKIDKSHFEFGFEEYEDHDDWGDDYETE